MGIIVAPFDGSVVSLFPTGHALGLKGINGESLLIHVGIDTVNLKGKYFSKEVDQGVDVKKGDILLKFDFEQIKNEGYDTKVIVVLENSEKYNQVENTKEGKISFTDKIFSNN